MTTVEAHKEEIAAQKRAENDINKSYLRRETSAYMMFGDIDVNWFWDHEKVQDFIRCWEEGYPLKILIKRFKRPPLEVGLLLMDLEYKEMIKPRDRGVWGN